MVAQAERQRANQNKEATLYWRTGKQQEPGMSSLYFLLLSVVYYAML